MNRENFIDEIVNELLTQVEPGLIAMLVSDGRRKTDIRETGFSDIVLGKQNLKKPEVSISLLDMLSEKQRKKCQAVFEDRYRRMIIEFIEIKENLLNHDEIPDVEFRSEIINYVTNSDLALGRCVYATATNKYITEKINKDENLALLNNFSSECLNIQKISEKAEMSYLKKDVKLTSHDCSQWFSEVKTSEKGMIQLLGSGKPFIFEGCYVAEVLPCYKPEKRNDFAFIHDAIRLLAGEEFPVRPTYTAVRMKGKYDGVNFIDVDFDTAYPKITDAIKASNEIQKKRYGDFK